MPIWSIYIQQQPTQKWIRKNMWKKISFVFDIVNATECLYCIWCSHSARFINIFYLSVCNKWQIKWKKIFKKQNLFVYLGTDIENGGELRCRLHNIKKKKLILFWFIFCVTFKKLLKCLQTIIICRYQEIIKS